MSLIDQLCQNILEFRGTMIEAQDLVKAFLADIMIKIFGVELRLQQQVFRNCNKNWKVVEQNLISYFQNSPIPIQTLFNENKYKNEGFISSDDEETIKHSKRVVVKRTKSIIREAPQNDNFKDEQIRIRDQVIQDITIGYYKDIQHLKEMFLRKERQQDDDIIDATYYDITKSFPAEVQVYLQSKLKEMSQQARSQQTKLQTQINQQQIEIDKLKKTISQLVSQADIVQQIKAILIIDRDMNRFWRGIQDVIGNKQIFEIFEKRQAGYGIDYKQIDELINQSQASYRVFSDYKNKIDEQYLLFTAQVDKELQLLRNQVKILTDKQNGQEQEKQKDFVLVRQTLKSGIEYVYEMKEEALKANFVQKLEQYAESILQKDTLSQVKRCIKGHALYKWMYLAKCEKMQKHKVLRKSQSGSINIFDVSCNPRGLLDKRTDDIKKQLQLLEYNLSEEQLQSQQLNVELNQMKAKHQSILMNYEMQLHKYLYLEQRTLYLENQNKYFERIFSLLMRRIGYPQFEVNERNINIILEKADSQIKQFQNKINQIQNKDIEDIHELTSQLIKKTIIRNKFNQYNKSTSYCQTDIFDVSMKIEDCIKMVEQNQFQLLQMQEQLRLQAEQEYQKEQEQLQQNNDDIPNVLLSDNEEELKEQKLVNKISQERSTEMDPTYMNQSDFDTKMLNPPKTADNKQRGQQLFTFISKKKTISLSTKNKEIQTEIQVDCRANLINKIFINDLDEFKKNVKEKPMFKEMKKVPQQSRPELQNTFATLISQHNVNKNRKQNNIFLNSINHKPIQINCQQKLKTEPSGLEIDQNVTFTNDRIKVVYTPGKKKVRSVSKNV
ncbi:unnamed protein product (macronuclear) [Paramecium tetraurelia]|uniref:Uncharacterized protein n=1 Tax=Paramecium tetraurelia TaxID=5888 RepID=A0C9G9_PARTE|nr:uncharacterized protein GSPATT00006742001 [Paramecium tetraurelia]CAK67436.1 unnamed protein product [Paramecium tetraurelia]|eukprot:XP_001434833.1 hypothetical protein (macronuclear) [Paramecium tetraurelia strain d4-2]